MRTLKSLGCEEIPIGGDDFSDSKITEGPRLTKLIKKNKSLSSYKHVNYSHKPEKCLSIFPALKNLHSLSTFRLEFYYDQSFKPEISQAFTHCTRNLKHLTNLDCILDKSTTNPTKSLQTLHFIAPLHSLSHLYLSLNSTPWLTDKSWSTFSYHLPSLTSLSLNLSYANDFTQKSLWNIFSSLSKLSLLTSFGLRINGSELLDFATLIFLFENLKNLSHFQDLTLSLCNCSHLKLDEKDPLAIGLALLNPSIFRKLSLEFYPNFCDIDLSALLIVLQRFSSLTSLSLKLSQQNQFTSKGISNLPATLSQFPNLQTLNLLTSPTIDAGSFFEMISLCLKDLKELISLTLDTCSGKKIDKLGVQQLCSQLPSLQKLQHLQLNFESQSRLDIQTLEIISQTLPKLGELKSFYFDCWATDESDANIFDDLVRSVGCLTNLRKLGLSLSGYFDMKKEMIKTMTASLKSLNCLAELSLSFRVCSEKDEIGEQFKNLIRVLENQEALVDIYIIMPSSMEDCPFREDKSFMEFIYKVENGPKKVHILGL